MTLGNWPRLGVLAFSLCACSVDDRALSVASGDGSPRDEVGAAGGSGGATERALQPDTDELGATSTARGVLTAKTAALDFGDQEVGLAGALQSWVVSNSGMTPTADLRVELSIAPHFEMIDNACRGPLAPGA